MTGPFAQCAAKLLDKGYSPVPILPGQKRPLPQCHFYGHWNELREKALTFKQVQSLIRWRPDLGVGVAGGYNCLTPLDIDTDDPEIKRAISYALPPKSVAKQGKKGGTLFYWNADGLIEGMKFKARKGKGWDFFAEVLVTGQTVIPPTIHPETLRPYKWCNAATLLNTKVDNLPQILSSDIEALQCSLSPWLPKPEEHALSRVYSSTSLDDKLYFYARTALRNETERLSILSEGRNWGLFKAACKLGRFIHHGALSEGEVADALMQATDRNGYSQVRHGGSKQAWKTLRSGLKKTQGDALPDLSNAA